MISKQKIQKKNVFGQNKKSGMKKLNSIIENTFFVSNGQFFKFKYFFKR